MATKKRTTKRAKSSAKAQEMESFRIVPETRPFITFKVTKQTVYWVLLLAVIVIFQLWIVKLQMEVSTLTDALNAL